MLKAISSPTVIEPSISLKNFLIGARGADSLLLGAGDSVDDGERRVMQEALFYGLERHVPDNHLLRTIDRFIDLSEVRTHLEYAY
jgi:hypothetical protein